MSLTRDLTRPLTRDLTRPADGSPYERFRNITTFAGADPDYIVIPDIALTGDFEIKAKLAVTAGSTRIFLNNPVANTFYMSVSGGASLLYVRHAGSTYVGAVSLILGEENSVRVKREGTSLKAWVNGVVSTDVTVTVSTQTIGVIGASQGFTSGYRGGLYDIEVYDAGALSRWYKLDEDWGTTSVAIDSSGNDEHGAATSLGAGDSERFGLNISSTPNQWENADKSTIIPLAY